MNAWCINTIEWNFMHRVVILLYAIRGYFKFPGAANLVLITMIQYNQGAAWQRLDIITAQSVYQLPKIDKENFLTFRPEGLRQES